MPTALFLSPHLDDVVFSCGGTLARLAQCGWRAVLVNAFTKSVPNPTGFALACQTDKGLPADADYMAIRRAEDAEAARIVGAACVRNLDFAEAPHRGYHSAPELFGGALVVDEVWRPLADSLAALAGEFSPELVFAPQGLGRHVDHTQVVRAVLRVWPAERVTWYRDTPYAVRDPAAVPLPGVPAESPHGVPLGEALAAKLDACAAYATQLPFQFGGGAAMRTKLAAFAETEGGERFGGAAPKLHPGAA